MENTPLMRMGLVGLGVIHELNSPLTTTALALELLAERLNGAHPPSPAKTAAELHRILAGVHRMHRLIGRLRALVKGTGAGRALVALPTVADTALELAQPALSALNLAISPTRGEDVEPASVMADSVLLEQAVLCLVINAAEASGPGGVVRLSVAGTALTVHDSGPGFLADQQDRTLGHTTKVEGLGIGLALTRLITEDVGGVLTAGNHSEGAWVTLSFPAE